MIDHNYDNASNIELNKMNIINNNQYIQKNSPYLNDGGKRY